MNMPVNKTYAYMCVGQAALLCNPCFFVSWVRDLSSDEPILCRREEERKAERQRKSQAYLILRDMPLGPKRKGKVSTQV